MPHVDRARPGLSVLAFALILASMPGRAVASDAGSRFPSRVRRIVLHVLGSPTYDSPERRFIFRDPLATHLLWRSTFGAHWIVWTDGSLWPRHVPAGEPRSFLPPPDGASGAAWQE